MSKILRFVLVLSQLFLCDASMGWASNPIAEGTHQSGEKAPLKKIEPGFPLKPGFELYMKYTAEIVPHGKLFIQKSTGEPSEPVKTYDELKKYLGPISTEGEALALVHFFTREPYRFLLQEKPLPTAIEPQDSPYQISTDITSVLKLPVVKREGGEWIIERDLLLYPAHNGETSLPARLIRSKERVNPNGDYQMEILDVLQEGPSVNNLLPHYR